MGVIVPEDYSVKLNECEKVEKYRNHARVIVEHESVSCNQDLKKWKSEELKLYRLKSVQIREIIHESYIMVLIIIRKARSFNEDTNYVNIESDYIMTKKIRWIWLWFLTSKHQKNYKILSNNPLTLEIFM